MGMVPLQPVNEAPKKSPTKVLKDIEPPEVPYGPIARNIAQRLKDICSELNDVIERSGLPERSKFKSACASVDAARKSLESIKD